MKAWNKSWFRPFLFFGSLVGIIIILIIIIVSTHLLTARYYKAKLEAQRIEYEQDLEAQRIEYEQDLEAQRIEFDKKRNEWLKTSIDNQIEKYAQGIYDLCFLAQAKLGKGRIEIVEGCHRGSGRFVGKGMMWNPQPGWDEERMWMESGVY